jgi:hypothetical protein
MDKEARDFLDFCRFWAPTLGKGVWGAWLEKKEQREAHMVMPDLQPFMSNTGVMIESRSQWKEHLKRTGSVELSKGDLKQAHEYVNPVTRKIEQAGRKEALKLALDKITHYKRPKSEVRVLLENVANANRKR